MQALIFDFDGTILDTETPEFASWSAIYHQHGVELPRDLWTSIIGLGPGEATFSPYTHLETLLGKPLDHDILRSRRRRLFYEMLHKESARAGVLTWLDTADRLGLGLAVASSSPRDWVVGHLERIGLMGRFAAIFSCEDVVRAKPDPALYLKAAAFFSAAPARCIAVEDSANGVRSAHAAGCYTIACPNPMTATLDFTGADLRVESLAELSLDALLAQMS